MKTEPLVTMRVVVFKKPGRTEKHVSHLKKHTHSLTHVH